MLKRQPINKLTQLSPAPLTLIEEKFTFPAGIENPRGLKLDIGWIVTGYSWSDYPYWYFVPEGRELQKQTFFDSSKYDLKDWHMLNERELVLSGSGCCYFWEISDFQKAYDEKRSIRPKYKINEPFSGFLPNQNCFLSEDRYEVINIVSLERKERRASLDKKELNITNLAVLPSHEKKDSDQFVVCQDSHLQVYHYRDGKIEANSKRKLKLNFECQEIGLQVSADGQFIAVAPKIKSFSGTGLVIHVGVDALTPIKTLSRPVRFFWVGNILLSNDLWNVPLTLYNPMQDLMHTFPEGTENRILHDHLSNFTSIPGFFWNDSSVIFQANTVYEKLDDPTIMLPPPIKTIIKEYLGGKDYRLFTPEQPAPLSLPLHVRRIINHFIETMEFKYLRDTLPKTMNTAAAQKSELYCKSKAALLRQLLLQIKTLKISSTFGIKEFLSKGIAELFSIDKHAKKAFKTPFENLKGRNLHEVLIQLKQDKDLKKLFALILSDEVVLYMSEFLKQRKNQVNPKQ